VYNLYHVIIIDDFILNLTLLMINYRFKLIQNYLFCYLIMPTSYLSHLILYLFNYFFIIHSHVVNYQL